MRLGLLPSLARALGKIQVGLSLPDPGRDQELRIYTEL